MSSTELEEKSTKETLVSYRVKMHLSQIYMSPIKRERLKKLEKLRKRKEQRDALPVLTIDEIRRHRLPYYEALIFELKMKGFENAGEFLKQLIDHQEEFRQQHGPDTSIWNRPRLLETKKHLDILFEGLRQAEGEFLKGNKAGECDEFLKLTAKYCETEVDWYWLAEQLMVQCVRTTSEYEGDGGKRHAIALYIYGRFLNDVVKDVMRAQESLNQARTISQGYYWSPNKILDVENLQTVFIESCILLYKAILGEAKFIMKYDLHKAIKLCILARKRAAESCHYVGETEALLLKGKCELLKNDTPAAIASQLKALNVQARQVNPEGVCECRVQLALAYIRAGLTNNALTQLNALMDLAIQHNLPHYIAEAYLYLGKYYISKGEATKATPLLMKAINLFQELGDIAEMEQVRNFAAISAATELLSKYTELISNCDRKGVPQQTYLNLLCRWKDNREPFWTNLDNVSISSVYDNFDDALQSSIGSGELFELEDGTVIQSLDYEVTHKSSTEIPRMESRRVSLAGETFKLLPVESVATMVGSSKSADKSLMIDEIVQKKLTSLSRLTSRHKVGKSEIKIQDAFKDSGTAVIRSESRKSKVKIVEGTFTNRD